MFEKHDLSAALESPDASDDDTGGTGRNCDDHPALPGDIVNTEQFAINSHNEVDMAAAEEVTCPYIQTASTYGEFEFELSGCESDLLILDQSVLQWMESEGIAVDCSGLVNQSGDGNVADASANCRDLAISSAPVGSIVLSATSSIAHPGDGNDLFAPHGDMEDIATESHASIDLTVAAKDCEVKPITTTSFYGMFLLSVLNV